jgi:hypothetical protein
MNEQQRAVVQQALDAFAVLKMNDYSGYECTKHETDKIDDAETALRQLLEQPEQEPSYWLGYGLQAHTEKPFEGATPLYTTPPSQPAAWVGLTDEDIAEAGQLNVEGPRMLPYAFARAIEAKLKEKNT